MGIQASLLAVIYRMNKHKLNTSDGLGTARTVCIVGEVDEGRGHKSGQNNDRPAGHMKAREANPIILPDKYALPVACDAISDDQGRNKYD
jgi:hypothetical protein